MRLLLPCIGYSKQSSEVIHSVISHLIPSLNLHVLVGDDSAHARNKRTRHRERQHKVSPISHEVPTAPTVLSAQAIDTVSNPSCRRRSTHSLDHAFSAFGPIPIFVAVAHFLELGNAVPSGVAIVLGPVIAPASILVELVADGLRHDVGIDYTFIGIFTTVGVVSAGAGKGEEEK